MQEQEPEFAFGFVAESRNGVSFDTYANRISNPDLNIPAIVKQIGIKEEQTSTPLIQMMAMLNKLSIVPNPHKLINKDLY